MASLTFNHLVYTRGVLLSFSGKNRFVHSAKIENIRPLVLVWTILRLFFLFRPVPLGLNFLHLWKISLIFIMDILFYLIRQKMWLLWAILVC